MSPEQASAESGLDGRTDQYSLACVLYEMLAGRAAVRGHRARAPRWRATRSRRRARSARCAGRRARRRRARARAGAGQGAGRAVPRHDRVRGRAGRARRSTCPRRRVAAGGDARAIAVLPFVNASADPENEYFSDGITDELITALTKVEGLHVASRTSVFALKGVREDVRTLGARLDVSAVLEGSVRRAGTPAPDHRAAHQRAGRADALVASGTTASWPTSSRSRTRSRGPSSTRCAPRCSRISAIRRRCATPRTSRPYHLYLKGRYWWNRRTQAAIAEGIRYFEAAIAEDAGLRAGLHRPRRLVRPADRLPGRAGARGSRAGAGARRSARSRSTRRSPRRTRRSHG